MSESIEGLLTESHLDGDLALLAVLTEIEQEATSVVPLPSPELAALLTPLQTARSMRSGHRRRGRAVIVTGAVVLATLGLGAGAAAASPELRVAVGSAIRGIVHIVAPDAIVDLPWFTTDAGPTTGRPTAPAPTPGQGTTPSPEQSGSLPGDGAGAGQSGGSSSAGGLSGTADDTSGNGNGNGGSPSSNGNGNGNGNGNSGDHGNGKGNSGDHGNGKGNSGDHGNGKGNSSGNGNGKGQGNGGPSPAP